MNGNYELKKLKLKDKSKLRTSKENNEKSFYDRKHEKKKKDYECSERKNYKISKENK